MTEEIRSQRIADKVTNAAVRVTTGSARSGAEREDKTLMISWAALLEEAVTKPGHIHEAYSRFWGYSIGNQILAYCQCVVCYVEYGVELARLRWSGGWGVGKGAGG